ncbi:Rieske (2Fe-2S) protein [Salinigranum sp. GCM10025319]|uniref:Rieske (2Fe-2S) protein n=1 Tax=Salinigranum sp. GCM10025319 TaxID=3252687 RepID=UPI00361BFD03
MDDDRRVASLDEVPADGTLLFTVRGDDGLAEVILTRLNGDVAAYRNYCQHWTDVRLDKGSGALVRNDEIVCQKHAATFEVDSGYCNFGPCEGSYLDSVAVEVEDGAVFLADDDYVFERLGPSGESQESSGSRIDFTGT